MSVISIFLKYPSKRTFIRAIKTYLSIALIVISISACKEKCTNPGGNMIAVADSSNGTIRDRGSSFFIKYKEQLYLITAGHLIFQQGDRSKLDETSIPNETWLFLWNEDKKLDTLIAPIKNKWIGYTDGNYYYDIVACPYELPKNYSVFAYDLDTSEVGYTDSCEILGFPKTYFDSAKGNEKFIPLRIKTKAPHKLGEEGERVFKIKAPLCLEKDGGPGASGSPVLRNSKVVGVYTMTLHFTRDNKELPVKTGLAWKAKQIIEVIEKGKYILSN